MTITEHIDQILPCATRPDVYLDERLQAPLTRDELDPAEWVSLTAQLATARFNCAGCPALVDCLYRAVVEVDVFGYAACTTPADRERIRTMLGIEIMAAPVDGSLSMRTGKGPVDHDAVMTVRRAHPEETFSQIAERLGCSLSTIKRHMRRARTMRDDTHRPVSATRIPTVDEVLECFDTIVDG
ncbi:hypothetical protein BH09ACT10_BH09ACT10_11000 [soil metagenome]